MTLFGAGQFYSNNIKELIVSTQSAEILSKSFDKGVWYDLFISGSGPFFTAILTALGYIFVQVNGRAKLHFNALVSLEERLNENLGIVYDNIYLIDNFIPAITQGKVYWSQLNTIEIPRSALSKLHDLKLINEANSFFSKTRKLNDDVKGIMSGYNDLKRSFTDGKLSKGDYILNTRIISKNLIVIKAFSEQYVDDSLVMLAKIRLHMRNSSKTIIGKLVRASINASISTLTKKEVDLELKKLKNELSDIQQESREEIDKVKQKVN